MLNLVCTCYTVKYLYLIWLNKYYVSTSQAVQLRTFNYIQMLFSTLIELKEIGMLQYKYTMQLEWNPGRHDQEPTMLDHSTT